MGRCADQSSDPDQSFKKKPKCAVVSGGKYGEYIPSGDHTWFKDVGKAMAAAASGGGVSYTAKQSYGLYPTTGTVCDYAYSRLLADAEKRRVMPILMRPHRPSSRRPVRRRASIDDVSAAVFESLLQCARDVRDRSREVDAGKARAKPAPKRRAKPVPARRRRR